MSTVQTEYTAPSTRDRQVGGSGTDGTKPGSPHSDLSRPVRVSVHKDEVGGEETRGETGVVWDRRDPVPGRGWDDGVSSLQGLRSRPLFGSRVDD